MIKSEKITAFAAAVMMTVSLAGCGSSSSSSDANAPAETEAVDENILNENTAENENTDTGEIKAVYGEIRTEFADIPDLSDYPLTPNDVPADHEAVYEAEDAVLTGNVSVADGGDFCSGGKFADGLNGEGDSITFKINIEYPGFYDLTFPTFTTGADTRMNYVAVDGENIGEIPTWSEDKFVESRLMYVHLGAGEHEISVLPYWGYIGVDCLKMTRSDAVTEETYNVTKPLSNPNADDNAKRLYKFLCDIYGKYSLAGQYADKGRESAELRKLHELTGKDFAVLGLDVSGYSLGSKAHGTESNTVEYAYDWYKNAGGIVQLCWHWTSPEEYAPNNSEHPWYSSFYKEASSLDLDKIMNGEDEKAYALLMDDIDNMSAQLARLRDAGVPVLWRPLHEASGGWFWWGDCSAESYKKLWNVMYDKMTNEHNLTNLIWVWNGQDIDWYPGDETVDICGWDIYAGNHVYTSQSGRFADMAVNYGTEKKLIALTENGCVPDPDNVFADNSRWLFWGTWADPFTLKLGVVINEEYTEKDILIKTYNHERVLTLDELPDLREYPID